MAEEKSGSSIHWLPLESNPEVFNAWAEKAGLVMSQAHFSDIYGFDPELLDIVPKPVKAVILLFPIDEDGEARRKAEDERIAREGQPKVDNTIFFIKQTISNACGTIGLIHALANAGVEFKPTSPLQKFIIECKDKTPLERAHLLETTPLFADIHAESAESGQTAVQNDTDLHFTCFVEAPDNDIRRVAQGADVSEDMVQDKKSTGMRLIELDGRRAGPIDHGECTDLLADAARLVRSRYISVADSVYFSLMALSGVQQLD
ncbi:peptidase C12, ubiquitin carboxyl-terminal hydrolase 1 [Agrocybe pediades]|nr:peptidase C12, ubiquitin carboxyl-terminal hydrolase 1 [Agrocybe pediades]